MILQIDFLGVTENAYTFLFLAIITFGIIGALSRKLTIAVFGFLLAYIHVTLNTNLWIFDGIMYFIVVIILLRLVGYIISWYTATESTESEE